MEQYCLYLRKSRSDQEAEARGEGETLARREQALLKLAEQHNLNVLTIYREVVSGETLAARPMMQQLLHEVEQGIWSGVLVMEVERLARGDTIDQGIVAQAFKFSDTKIITPMKTYDPNNEFDEEYFEFGLFMSRREYKTINRRLQRGRNASINEGKYVGSIPPFGYKRIKLENDKGFTLQPDLQEAEAVKLIFEWYAGKNGEQLGPALIAQRLDQLGIKPRKNNHWSESSIRNILINPVYIGMTKWQTRAQVKKSINGSVKKTRPRNHHPLLVKGLHPAIIDEQLFHQVNKKLDYTTPVNRSQNIQNPLASIIVCAKCGHKMVRRPYVNKPSMLICRQKDCDNIGASLELVEQTLIAALKEWVKDVKVTSDNLTVSPTNTLSLKIKQLTAIDNSLKIACTQMDKTYDLLEQGIYSIEKFSERFNILSDKIQQLQIQQEQLASEIKKEKEEIKHRSAALPKVEKLIDIYWAIDDPTIRNNLLKEILDHVSYSKDTRMKKNQTEANFTLKIYPLILPKD